MAPREEVDKKVTPPASPGCGEVGFWQRLASLPVFQTAKELVASASEKQPVLLGAVQQGVHLASGPLATVSQKFPHQVEKLDSVACRCLDALEDKCPAIQKPVNEVIDDVKTKSNGVVKQSMRTVLRSYMGRQVLKGLNTMIDLSEAASRSLTPLPSPDTDTEESDKPPMTTTVVTICKKSFTLVITVPLKLWLKILKKIRMSILHLAGKKCPPSTTCSLTPEKKAEIDKRRKLSPKKRIKRTFVQQLMALVLQPIKSPLGRYCSSAIPFSFSLPESLSGSPNKHGKLEKRKHDDLSDEEDDEDLFDLDNYLSDEDSDYEPSEHGSTDSLEYQEGDTESDIEEEEIPNEKSDKILKQIKDENIIEEPEKNKPTDKIPEETVVKNVTEGTEKKADESKSPSEKSKKKNITTDKVPEEKVVKDVTQGTEKKSDKSKSPSEKSKKEKNKPVKETAPPKSPDHLKEWHNIEHPGAGDK